MDTVYDAFLTEIEYKIVTKAKFHKNTVVKFKHNNKYYYGIIDDVIADNNCNIVYVINTNDKQYRVNEKLVWPITKAQHNTLVDAQKPAYFPF